MAKASALTTGNIQVLFPFAILGDIKFRNALFCLGFKKEGGKNCFEPLLNPGCGAKYVLSLLIL